MGFKVSRHGFPIETVGLKHSVITGITYGSLTYPLWRAAVRCGATLDELMRLDQGKYPLGFQAKLVAYNQVSTLEDLHRGDASATASEKAAKRARKK